MNNIHFKIVRKHHSEYYSAAAGWSTFGDTTRYVAGEWVFSPKGSFLFVFQTLEQAKNYLRTYRTNSPDMLHIFECEVTGIDTNNAFKFKHSIPDGTIFAYGVKITREVIEKKFDDGDELLLSDGGYKTLFKYTCGKWLSLDEDGSITIHDNITATTLDEFLKQTGYSKDDLIAENSMISKRVILEEEIPF